MKPLFRLTVFAALAVSFSFAVNGAEQALFRRSLSTEFGEATLAVYAPRLKSSAPAILLIAEEEPSHFVNGTSSRTGCQWPVSTINGRGYAAVAVDCSRLAGDFFDARVAAVKAAIDELEGAEGSAIVDTSRIAVIGEKRLAEAAARAASADKRVKFALCCNPLRANKGDKPQEVWQDETVFDFAACGAKCVLGYEMSGPARRDFDAPLASYHRWGGPQITGYDWDEYMRFLDREGWKVDLANERLPVPFKVLAWNLEGQSRKQAEVESMIEIVKDINPDVILISENYGIMQRLLEGLGAGWYGEFFSMSLALVTRHRVLATEHPYIAPWNYLDNSEHPFNFGLAELEVEGQRVRCCPLWINWEPVITAKKFAEGYDAVTNAMVSYPRFSSRRIDEIKGILGSIKAHMTETDDIPIVIGGDFNGDSDLDWTDVTKDVKGHHGLSIPWPEHIEMRKAGFTDTYRELNPFPKSSTATNEILNVYGSSWATPGSWRNDGTCSANPNRIDFIYSKGPKLKPVRSEMFQAAYHRPFEWHGKQYASFPSDHGFALTEFTLETPPPAPKVVVSRGGADVTKNIPYVADGGNDQLLDLSIPKCATNFPTVVWFHGGGLTGGHRGFIAIDNSRVAIATVEYPLMKTDKGGAITNGPISPEHVLDSCAAAVKWVKDHIAEYGGSTNKIYISGHSAGGYITYMLGLDKRWLGKYGLSPYDFAGYLPVSGQVTKHFAVRRYFGQGDNQLVPIIDEWAPIHYCAKNTPRFRVVLGDKRIEWKLRVQESEFMYETMKGLGNKNFEFISIPRTNHGSCCPPAMGQLMDFITSSH